MNMGVIGDIAFGDEDAMKVFIGEHAICHSNVNTHIAIKYGPAPVLYPLDVAEEIDADWLLMHYRTHQYLATRLSLSGLTDLASIDLKDEGQFYTWTSAHNLEHSKINFALGLT